MAEKKVVLTYEGLKNMETELENLKTVRRKEVAEKIKEARGQGDLSENAEYDAAKEEQAEIESRIVVLEKMLRNAEVIDDDEVSLDIITVGSKVKLYGLLGHKLGELIKIEAPMGIVEYRILEINKH